MKGMKNDFSGEKMRKKECVCSEWKNDPLFFNIDKDCTRGNLL